MFPYGWYTYGKVFHWVAHPWESLFRRLAIPMKCQLPYGNPMEIPMELRFYCPRIRRVNCTFPSVYYPYGGPMEIPMELRLYSREYAE